MSDKSLTVSLVNTLQLLLNQEDTVVTENGRKFRVSKRIPKYAGYWMCKQVLNTDSQVHWSLKLDNLAATLEESVAMCISKIPSKV